jgi:NADH:ubiquinone oxidoreductase subunit F (NADH-binding)
MSVCNADEGGPRRLYGPVVLEGDPHAVIEAMAIAAYAVGSDEGYVYVRAEYPIAVKRLEIACNQRGSTACSARIFSNGLQLRFHIRLGAGALSAARKPR